MRLQIDVNDQGGLEVGAQLSRIGTRAGSLRPVEDAVHTLLMRAIDYQYGRGGPAVGGWRPDAPETIRRKARLGLDVRVMHETGRLRVSLTTKGSEDHIWRIVGRSELVMSTRVPYAEHLNTGGRPPVLVSQAAAKRAADLIRAYLVDGTTKAT